jgi:4-oxalocrotonate tautomerase
MPLVDIQLIKGVFTSDQKKLIIQKVTDAMVSVEGEPMRSVTWVRVQEMESGDWAIGHPSTFRRINISSGRRLNCYLLQLFSYILPPSARVFRAVMITQSGLCATARTVS